MGGPGGGEGGFSAGGIRVGDGGADEIPHQRQFADPGDQGGIGRHPGAFDGGGLAVEDGGHQFVAGAEGIGHVVSF